MFRSLGSAALAVLLLVPLPLAAQVQDVELTPSEVAAQGHYLMGREHYDAGRFAEAATEFQEAYDLSHRPELFFNLFLAHRDAGHTREAATALRAYLEAVPDAPNAEMLGRRLAVLDAQIAEEEARERAAAEAEASVEAPEPAPEAPSAASPSVGPWVVIGVGGAIAVGAIVTGALTATTYGDVSARCPNGICEPGYDLEGQRSTGSALGITTDVLGGIAAATLVTGIVWAIVDATSGGAPTTEAEGTALRCSPLGCEGRF